MLKKRLRKFAAVLFKKKGPRKLRIPLDSCQSPDSSSRLSFVVVFLVIPGEMYDIFKF